MDLPAAAAMDPGDVLNQPTRARLFATLSELKRPAGTKELGELMGLHPNGIRVHLDRLEAAGLVARSSSPQGRGRPRHAWKIAPGAQPGGDQPSAYAALGRWLGRAIPVQPGLLRGIEATGREIGRELAPPDSSDPEAMLTALTALGFQPSLEGGADDRITYRLGNCPYREAVRENQEVVCTLHRGITRGLLDVLDPGADLDGFVPRDPDVAGCLIELSRAAEVDGR